MERVELWRCPGCGELSMGQLCARGRCHGVPKIPTAPARPLKCDPVIAFVPGEGEGEVVVGLDGEEAARVRQRLASIHVSQEKDADRSVLAKLRRALKELR